MPAADGPSPVAFVALPIFLGGLEPSIDDVAEVALASLDVQPEESPGRHLLENDDTAAGATTLTLAFAVREGGERWRYSLKSILRRRFALTIAVWTNGDLGKLDEIAPPLFESLRWRELDATVVAPAALPRSLRSRQATIHNRLGVHASNDERYAGALPFFLSAIELDPTTEQYFKNALYAFNHLGQHAEALELLDSHEGPADATDELLSWEAWHRKEAQQTEKAIEIYERLFSGDYRSDEDFTAYVELLAEAGRVDEMNAAFERYVAKGDSSPLQILWARMENQVGRTEDALRRLEARGKRRDGEGTDRAIALARVDLLRSLERQSEAHEVVDGLISDVSPDADLYRLRAEIELDLDLYRRAKASLEEALELAPDDEDARWRLDYVSGLLGEGDNTAIKQPIDPVDIPAGIAPLMPDADARPEASGYSAWLRSWVTVIEFEPGKVYKESEYRRIKVLNSQGVSTYSSITRDFDPLSERLHVNRLVIQDEEGTEVARGRTSDYYIIDKQLGRSATHDRTLTIPVPSLRPGYTIDVVITVERLSPPEAFPFTKKVVASFRPILLTAVCVRRTARHSSARVLGARVHRGSPGGHSPDTLPLRIPDADGQRGHRGGAGRFFTGGRRVGTDAAVRRLRSTRDLHR